MGRAGRVFRRRLVSRVSCGTRPGAVRRVDALRGWTDDGPRWTRGQRDVRGAGERRGSRLLCRSFRLTTARAGRPSNRLSSTVRRQPSRVGIGGATRRSPAPMRSSGIFAVRSRRWTSVSRARHRTANRASSNARLHRPTVACCWSLALPSRSRDCTPSRRPGPLTKSMTARATARASTRLPRRLLRRAGTAPPDGDGTRSSRRRS